MELIISNEALKENQMNIRNMNLKRDNKRKEIIKRKAMIYTFVIGIIIGFLLTGFINSFTSKSEVTKTNFGEYTCEGRLIKTCTSSKVVMKNLGV